MGLVSKNVEHVRSTARNSFRSILQHLISCKSFLPRVSEQNKAARGSTYREREREDRKTAIDLLATGCLGMRDDKRNGELFGRLPERKREKVLMGWRLFQRECTVGHHTRSLSTELTRQSLILEDMSRESSFCFQVCGTGQVVFT
jgi:hypothetical protein